MTANTASSKVPRMSSLRGAFGCGMVTDIAVRLKVEQNQLVGIFAEFVLGVGWLERL